MRTVFAALVLLLLSATGALATETNYWRHPGTHPLSHSPDGRDAAALSCAYKLPAPSKVMAAFKQKLAQGQGEIVTIKNGTRFSVMTYEGCKMWANVEARWDMSSSHDQRMEVITIVAKDGSIWKFGRPFICNNWSLLEVIRPPKSNCYRIYFDDTKNADAVFKTASELTEGDVAKWPSAAQAYLYPETRFTYHFAHLDVTDDEMRTLLKSDCFGVGDATGFHHIGGKDCFFGFCQSGQYPSVRVLRAYREVTGVSLPEEEPQNSFWFVLANGKGYLSIPIAYADRFLLNCVAVKQYQFGDKIPLSGLDTYRSEFAFDTVTHEEGAHSLKVGKRIGGDVVLIEKSKRTRYLFGEHFY